MTQATAMNMEFKSIDEEVIHRLSIYRKNNDRIDVLKRQAIGLGLYIEVDTSTAFENGGDLLSVLHERLKGMPEVMYLSMNEQELATVWRSYLSDDKNVALSSKLKALKSVDADDPEDQKLLEDLARRMATAVRSRKGRVFQHQNEMAVAIERADARLEAENELDRLKQENIEMDIALDKLRTRQSAWELLIRKRYIEEKSKYTTTVEMAISETTHDRYRKKAIEKLAEFLGITK